jgi:DNA-binding response OmpR family regulator
MKPHILFVDDEAPIRELLSLFFRKKDFTVTTAMTPAEAKALATQNLFNLAIVDVNLAGESGLDLLHFFKQNYPSMPVIIFTGLAPDENLMNAVTIAGANGFMRKTDSLGNLYLEVTKHLPAQNP